MKRTIQRLLPFLLLLLLGIITACRGTAGQTQDVDTSNTAVAFIGDLAASATASGQVTPSREAQLSVSTPGLVTQVHVRVGDSVEAGDVLLRLDSSDLALNVANMEQALAIQEANLADLTATPAEADVAAAAAAVTSAQAQLDELLAGPSEEEIEISEASVQSAQASVSSASADLASTQDSIKESQILAAQAALYAAQQQQEAIAEENAKSPNAQNHQALLEANQAVADAQATLDELMAGPNVDAAANGVASAQAKLEGSQADLNLTLAGPTAVERANAEAQLASAQAQLDDLLAGPTDEAIRAAEAEVAQAQLNLADAQERLDKATVTAPFWGVVTAVNFSEGELASGVVVELVDNNSLEVVLSVDEVDIADYTVGQPATITLETWPDTPIDGTISLIAPSASQSNSALVSYDVHVALGDTDLPVRVGMTANANLITEARQGVLLLPNQAIQADRQAGKYFVTLLKADGSTERVEVTIGLRDAENTQIVSGLVEGDEVVISLDVPTFQFGPENQ